MRSAGLGVSGRATKGTWHSTCPLLDEFLRVPELLCEKHYKLGCVSKQLPHDAGQLAALRKAGVAETRLRPLGPVS